MNFLKVAVFTATVVSLFVCASEVVTRISGQYGVVVAAEGVNPEAGEAIFWGKGKCHTCHSLGVRGSAIRCPNLGDGAQGALIGFRAEERAKERGLNSGTEYLVESLADPGAYAVKGFKNEMPFVYKPPISLMPDEIMAVISYLQSLGGEVDIGSIKLPDVMKVATATELEPWSPYIQGDPEWGEGIFFDPEGNAGCFRCHTVLASDGTTQGRLIGPDLTTVAGTRTAQFIIESILKPDTQIAGGFEQVLIITTDGQYIDGIPKMEDDDVIVLTRKEGNDVVDVTISKSHIEKRDNMTVSMMPGNYGEILTIDELHHILAFLLTQTGQATVANNE